MILIGSCERFQSDVAFLELCREVGVLNRKGQSSAQLGMKVIEMSLKARTI